mmetsp:Transcript_1262/g.3273  ORF Transcript_1262/g.3273 Transcript_1262/m.3273 type:complete len:86 (-) Transcript_1262:1382-1639(-)
MVKRLYVVEVVAFSVFCVCAFSVRVSICLSIFLSALRVCVRCEERCFVLCVLTQCMSGAIRSSLGIDNRCQQAPRSIHFPQHSAY